MANWKCIHEDFGESTWWKWTWERLGINYKQTEGWVKKIGLDPKKDAEFAQWLLEIKHKTPEQVSDLEEIKLLRKEYSDWESEWKEINKEFCREGKIVSWIKKGLNYQEAKQWVGKDSNSNLSLRNLELIAHLKKNNFTPEEYSSFTSKDAQGWLDYFFPQEIRGNIKELNIYSLELKGSLKLTGFTSLEKMNCNFNELTSLDLSDCSNSLKELGCRGNKLSILNVSGFTNLQKVLCECDSLTILDCSDCPKLELLWCGNDKLTDLEISNCPSLEGSLSIFKSLSNLETLNITNTNFSEGLDDLPKSCRKLICNSNYSFKSIEIVKELGKYGKCSEGGDYNLNKWRDDKANDTTASAVPLERLFVIRSNIKKYVDKWSKEEDYNLYEWNYWKRAPKGIALSRLQNPDDFSKSWWTITGIQLTNRAVLVIGGSLVFAGQSDTENPNSQTYTKTGGVIAIVSPFVETITSYVNDQIYDAKKKKWDEFVNDTKDMLDNYHDLKGILEKIEISKFGEVNKSLKKLDKVADDFLKDYDEDENETVNIFEIIEKREEFAKDLSKEDKEKGGGSQLGNIVNALKELEAEITKHRQRATDQVNIEEKAKTERKKKQEMENQAEINGENCVSDPENDQEQATDTIVEIKENDPTKHHEKMKELEEVQESDQLMAQVETPAKDLNK